MLRIDTAADSDTFCLDAENSPTKVMMGCTWLADGLKLQQERKIAEWRKGRLLRSFEMF
jgi:hypothetical protein